MNWLEMKLTSFDSDGFTLGTSTVVNENGEQYCGGVGKQVANQLQQTLSV